MTLHGKTLFITGASRGIGLAIAKRAARDGANIVIAAKTAEANPKLPELLIKAQTEAIKRFYDDKAFAVKAYMVYDKQPQTDVERIYDLYAKPKAFERVPYVLSDAVKAVIAQQSDPQLAAQMKAYDFHKVIDNSIIERLVKEKYFETLFGAPIRAEEDRKAKLAFK